MISSQCDERLDERLRRAAQTCQELGKHATANMFLEAADTILELREMAQKANAENAKLRELADAVKEFVEDAHCEDCPCRRDCDDNNRIFCASDFSYHAFADMRELGVEA